MLLRITLLLALSFGLFSLAAQAVQINESVAANTQLLDDDGDTPDWLELRNTTADAIDLGGWQLTDDLSNETYWQLPAYSLTPDEHLLVWASGKDRVSANVARTFAGTNAIFRYIAPQQPVSEQWTTVGFDDSGWDEGVAGFGYGDGDDQTVIPNGTRSVFLRHRFTVNNLELLERILLDVDYDDSFVAYLNGTEVARANIQGGSPPYNAFALTDREAEIYNGGLPVRFLIDNPQELLQVGENVLCIQAHNISEVSSDFSIIPFLSALYAGPTADGGPLDVLIPMAAGQGLHTDFKISSAGETLYLLDAQGELVDSLVTGPLPTDISVGIPYGTDQLGYFEAPTPGEPNLGDYYEGINTESIVFSHPGGSTPSLALSLSGVTAPAVIRYTLDATIPNENSTAYDGLISITENTVVRARIFRENYLASATQDRTYLVGMSHDLPIISLVTEPGNFFDNDYGIYVFGDNASSGFPHFGANFWEDWERPVNLSLYEPDGQLGLQLYMGVKIFGGWSRGQDQRSLSLFARKQYGPSEIDYPLFPDRSYDTYQAMVLRNSGNDFLNSNMRDVTLTSLMEGSGLETQANRPAATYINGEYWGFYNMREKINEHYLASRYDLDPDEVNILEFEGGIIHGNNQSYIELIDFVSNNSLVSDANYQEVVDRIDVENYIIYQVAQIYFNNTDWPGNNIKFWQPDGGKWRWILFDTDFGFGTWNPFDYFNNTLAFALEPDGEDWPNPAWSTLLFRSLVENISFRNAFVNRYADEMNSRFLPERVRAHIDSIAARIGSEINRHYERWEENPNDWQGQVDVMREFGELRPLRAKQHIRSVFDLVDFHELTIEFADTEQGYVRINNRLTITEDGWQGDYFQGVPFVLQAIARPGYMFSHWESSAQGNTSSAEISIDLLGPTTLEPIFVVTPEPVQAVVINEINYNSSEDFATGDWIELYNPNATPLDLSNWQFRDDDDSHNFVFPAGTLLAGNGYLVVTQDLADFQALYPSLSNVIGDFDFGLRSTADAVRIYDANDQLQDEVYYRSEAPWPTAPNGQGPTLELISPELDNSLPQNWANVHPMGSPGATNIITNTQAAAALLAFRYFPNPLSEQGNLQFELAEATEIRIGLYDARGVLVQQLVQASLSAGEHTYQINVKQLPAGTYFLETQANGVLLGTRPWVKF